MMQNSLIILHLKISDATSVAPVTSRSPAEGLILGSTDLPSLGVRLALEFGLQSLRRIGVQLATFAVGLDLTLRGLVDLRCAECTS
jgi:hypothetical protein